MFDDETPERAYDVILIGAGISGIYTLYRLVEAGFNVLLLEAGGGAGGTWYWNRYPGCRFDLESHGYAYFFSQDLINDWTWSEAYASQPETEAYLNHVLDRFDLRQHIRFNARVSAVRFNAETTGWSVTTEEGDSFRSRYVVTAIGFLSAPIYPQISGRDDFTGQQYHTALWPHHKVELAGQRVAVIGTGSSGVQIIQTIAHEVDSLTIFQRTPNWCAPLNNHPLSPESVAKYRAGSEALHEYLLESGGGTYYRPRPEKATELDPAERRRIFQELYDAPGMALGFGNFSDALTDPTANRLLNEFLAEKIRERVHDPDLARKLIPTDHGYGQKRPPMEIGYYEVFNQDNVTLVSTAEEPMVRITASGIKTTEQLYEVDVIVYATGFEAVTGAFNRIEIDGVDGTLKHHWEGGPRTHLGILSAGFPNFLMVGGAQSTTGNIPRYTEVQTDFVVDLLSFMRKRGLSRVDTTGESEDAWSEFASSMARDSLKPEATSWSWGTNVPGRKRTFLLYAGGLPRYREALATVASDGYQSLRLN